MTMTSAVNQGIINGALFANALLFIPQSMQVIKEKATNKISLLILVGLILIQIGVLLYCLYNHDYFFLVSYATSLIICSALIAAGLPYFQKKLLSQDLTVQEILNQLPCQIYWKDGKGMLLGCNENKWQDASFITLSDYKNKNYYAISANEINEQGDVKNIDKIVMTEGRPIVVEERVLLGREEIIYLTHRVPLKNKQNKIVGVLGLSIDITKKNRDINDHLETLENVIAVMPGNVYWLNKEGVYLGCNDNQAKLIKLSSRKEIVGKRNIEIPGFFIPEVLDKYNKEVIKTGKSITVEEPAVLPDGRNAIFLSSKVPLYNGNNEIVGIVGISIDITDRKRQEQELMIAKEEAERSNKVKSDFISNMEHDIRTPLVGVYGMIDILANQETDLEKKSLLKEVSICAKELMDYCDGILDFSRIEAESFPIVSKSFTLRKVVESIITIETIAAKHKKLDLSFSYDERLPIVVCGDPYRLKRILINLLSNAIKFTKEGYAKLSVRLNSQDYENRKIVITFTIEDTGMGIPDDKKALIYERFTKIVPSNKGLYKGLGLGLRIVKQFVDELDGDIHLKSEISKGSTFMLFLPFKLPLSNKVIDEE